MITNDNEHQIEYDEQAEVEYKAAIKKYLLLCVLMEGSKIIIFTLIFGYFHLIPEFLMSLFVLMLVRCNGGGLHCKHYISCFLLSLLVLFLSIYSGIYISLYKFMAIPLLLICSILGYWAVPIVSDNRPAPNDKLIKQSKLRTVIIILLYCFLICICPYNKYLNIGTWTIIIHILQLLLAKFMKRRDIHVST